MNYLKHSLCNITKLIVSAIKKGDVGCYDHIHTSIPIDDHIIGTIYRKDDVGVYIVEEWDDHNDGYTYLYAKGIPDADLQRIKASMNQMLKGVR